MLRAQCGDRDALALLTAVVYRKLTLLEQPEVFREWVFRIASRAAFRHLKKRNRWPDRARDEDAFEHLVAADPPPREDTVLALLASDVISPASRAVLALHFQEELSLPDVAAILEIPLGTVKSRLSYGLSALRKHLNRERNM